MPRLHLFEWEDQPWLPRAIRDFITHHLQYTFAAPATATLREAVTDILIEPLRRSGEAQIVDVCSGGGGPLIAVLPTLSVRLGRPVSARLTDLFPNEAAFKALGADTNGAVKGELRAVSAFDVPQDLGTFQTVFTALHHFRPEDAKRVLADAAAKGRTIAVIEPFNRRAIIATTIGGFLLGWFRTPFMGRMTLARFLWTYPIPIAPAILAWDGCVSCLRAYSPEEMLAMGREVAPHYHWNAGEREAALPVGSLTLTYLTGEPTERRFSAGLAVNSPLAIAVAISILRAEATGPCHGLGFGCAQTNRESERFQSEALSRLGGRGLRTKRFVATRDRRITSTRDHR